MNMDKLLIEIRRIWYRFGSVKNGFFFFVSLNIADAVLTYRACQLEAVEFNPLFAPFVGNLLILLAIKGLIVFFVFAVIALMLPKYPGSKVQVNNLLFFASGIYAFICFHSIYQLMLLGEPFVRWFVSCSLIALISAWFLIGGENE